MEIFRRAANPWGQDVLLGIAWDLMWAALIVGVGFVVGHALYVGWVARRGTGQTAAAKTDAATLPAHIERHPPAARLFHWLMAVAMIALLVTAFFPVVGIRFPWVTIHWIAGLALLATIVYHVVHASVWQDFRSMWVGREDWQEGRRALRRFFARAEADRRTAGRPPDAGKYPLDHKLYHHVASLVTVAAIATGVLMMFRIDTPFWAASPYFLSDATWGWVYVLHGFSGVALITLTVAHVYFAVRPEKRWMTRSMIKGWITADEYRRHYDPARWVLERPARRPPPLAGETGPGSPEAEPAG